MDACGPQEEVKDKDGRILGYEHPEYRLRIVGRYTTACGGCDTVKTQDEVESRVRAWHGEGFNVIFEGLLISHIYGRWAQVARDCPPYQFLFMATPVEECLRRVQKRREERGNTKPLNPKNTVDKYNDMHRVMKKCKADGLSHVMLSNDEAFEWIMEHMFGDGQASAPASLEESWGW